MPSIMNCGTSQFHLCGDINGSKITHDKAGNVFVSGFYASSVDIHPGLNDTFALDYAGAYTSYIAKFNASGIPLWQLSHNYFTTFNIVYDIQTDSSGNLYVSGSFRYITDFDPSPSTYNVSTNNLTGDGFLLKLSPLGSLLWVAYLNTPEGSKTRSITIDPNGKVSVSVQYWGKAMIFDSNNALVDSLPWTGTNDAAILQFSPQGQLLKKLYFGSPTNDYILSLTADTAGNIYAGGTFGSTVSSNAPNLNLNSFGIVIAKISPNFDVIWINQLTTSTGKVYDLAYMPKTNSVVAVGTFNQTVDFDPTGGTFQLMAFAYDGFVAHYSANNGAFGCAFKIGGRNASLPLFYDDVAYSVEYAGGNDYYVYGLFSDTTDFEPGTAEYLKTVGA